MDQTLTLTLLGSGLALATLPRILRRLQLSRAKHPSLTGHARMARRVSRLIPYYAYDERRFFDCDGAPAEIAAERRASFDHLARTLARRHARTVEMTRAAAQDISDLQFTGRYRVPFQFSAYVREHLSLGAFLSESDGVTVTDLDGRQFIDLTGAYGVNLFGTDFYKRCIREGARRVEALGPVLGSYHPCVAWNAAELKRISGLDEVSFHMSGTEAVMQAVRLARYHTGRKRIVRFSGAYHGWWDDVQPGPGNPLAPGHTYTLRDMSERTLHVLRTRRDIACVLVNPLQALHANAAAPGDSTLVDGSRRAGFDRAAYTEWLQQLRQVCTDRGIVLILDEVFVGFRLAAGGAQAYFGVQADLVTYGKTLGGGLPVGVLCGRAALMRRFREDRPADICFARGTFNSHPYVMGAMQVFLEHLSTPEVQALYGDLDARWNQRREALNQRLAEAGAPVRLEGIGTIWTVTYTQPGRYHWMLQYYLRAQGLALSWVGTGRLIFNLAFADADFERVVDRFVAAVHAMREGGWWWAPRDADHRSIRRVVLGEILARRLGRPGAGAADQPAGRP